MYRTISKLKPRLVLRSDTSQSSKNAKKKAQKILTHLYHLYPSTFPGHITFFVLESVDIIIPENKNARKK